LAEVVAALLPTHARDLAFAASVLLASIGLLFLPIVRIFRKRPLVDNQIRLAHSVTGHNRSVVCDRTIKVLLVPLSLIWKSSYALSSDLRSDLLLKVIGCVILYA